MAYQIETTCICGDPETSKNHSFGAVSVPIYQTATFAHPGIGESTGHNYTRESNPTRDELEKTVSALEGAVDTVACTSGMAVPSFFLGMILTYVFGLILHMFQPGKFIEPSENFGKSAQYLLFPALAVALPKIAMVVKFLRSSILTEMNREYVRTAYSRGNTETAVLYGHVLKNAMIPVVTCFAMVIAEILAGSIVAEQVFSVPGIGRLLISSISNRDYPVVQAIVLYITSVVVLINFAVDMIYQVLDPRVRTAEE